MKALRLLYFDVERIEPKPGLSEVRKGRVERNSVLFAQEVDSFSACELEGRPDERSTYPETPSIVIDRDVRKVRLEFSITQHLGESHDAFPIDRDHCGYTRRGQDTERPCPISGERRPAFGCTQVDHTVEMRVDEGNEFRHLTTLRTKPTRLT